MNFLFQRPNNQYLLSNLNPSLGLANGTPIIYHSLVLDDCKDDQCIKQQVHDVTHSTDIFLVHQPKFICVEVPSADPAKFIGLTLVPGRVVIPISLKKNLGSKYWKLQVDGLGVIQTQMKIHDVSLKFALTAHKEQFIILSFKYCQSFIVLLFYLYQVQGQTCKKAIINRFEQATAICLSKNTSQHTLRHFLPRQIQSRYTIVKRTFKGVFQTSSFTKA